MSHKMLRPLIVKVSVLGYIPKVYFPLRNIILSISNILSILFNKFIENGVYPDVLKTSKVIILYKKGKNMIAQSIGQYH